MFWHLHGQHIAKMRVEYVPLLPRRRTLLGRGRECLLQSPLMRRGSCAFKLAHVSHSQALPGLALDGLCWSNCVCLVPPHVTFSAATHSRIAIFTHSVAAPSRRWVVAFDLFWPLSRSPSMKNYLMLDHNVCAAKL